MFDSLRLLRRFLGVSAAASRRRRPTGRQRSAPPALEVLETRLAPAITISPTSGTLPTDIVHVPYSQAITDAGAATTFDANQVVSYVPGTLADSGYDNPSAALGGLDPVTGSFGGSDNYLTPFDPAYSSSDLVEVGAGGSLVLKLAQTASTNGYTIGVHTGFGLADADYPNGTNTDPASYFNSWLRQADVQVSADGVNWANLGTITFSSPSNYDAGAATDPEGGSLGVAPAANPGKPFLGSLSSFNGLDWQSTLAVLNGSAGGTWLNLSGVKDEHGHALSGVNYIKFSVPTNPPLDPNTGNPELMMVDAVVGTNSSPTISASGGTGNVTLTVSNVHHSIAGLTIPHRGTNQLTISGAPLATGTETFTVTATDAAGDETSTDYSITVNPAVPLTLTISGAASVNEEVTYTLNLSGSDVLPQTISDWTINWGDGHVQKVAGNPDSVTHVYADGPHSYTIHASATDQTGTYRAGNTLAVEVNHVPPTLNISGASSVNEGVRYTLDLSGTDTHKITHWTINWGDGSAPQIVKGDPKSVTHVYLDGPSTDLINATATDNAGTYAAGDTVDVTVNYVPPTLSISGPSTVNERATYTLRLSESDVRPILEWTINWGDGSPLQTVKGDPRTVTHVYATGPNNYTISATATDESGTFSADNTVAVSVLHLAPKLIISGPDTVKEGQTYTLSLSGTDTLPITEWIINWGDGSPPVTVSGNPRSVTHAYADGPNDYTISAMAVDDDGIYNARDTVTVKVKR